MTGTIINLILILIGSTIGLLLGKRISEDLRHAVLMALGLFTAAFSISLFLKTGNSLVVLIALLIGLILGEWWQIESGLAKVGIWLEKRFNNGSGGDSQRFLKGFLTASLLFITGPMAILGSIQDGINGDFSILTIKAIMDGFASIAFASSMGFGVIFSGLIVFLYQGSLSLLAVQLQFLNSDIMLNEISAVGGVMLLGLAISEILEIKKIRVANMIPAFLVIPFIIWLFQYFGIY